MKTSHVACITYDGNSSVFRYSAPDMGAEHCDEHVCVFVCVCVCLRSYLRNYTFNLNSKLFVLVTDPWLDPPLAA